MMTRITGVIGIAMITALLIVPTTAAVDEPRPGHSDMPQLPPSAGIVPAAPNDAKKPPNRLDSDVDAVRRMFAARGSDAALALAEGRLLRVRGGRVCVIVETQSGSSAAARVSLAKLSAQIDSSYKSLIRAYVPVGRIGKLADAPGVNMVRRPMAPRPDVLSAGVGETGASAWHTEGWTGAGVNVGIIDVGFTGYLARLGTELPPAANVVAWGGSGYPEDGGDEHGTAVAEIVYDVAPGAKLYLARVQDEVDIGNAMEWMLGQGVDVINMSLGWPAWGLGDGTGEVNDIVTAAVSAGVFWANAAGNDRLGHWKGDFVDANGNGYLDWGIVDSSLWELNTFWCSKGDPILGVLRWQDSWGFATQDYDLYLYRWSDRGWQEELEVGGQNAQDGEGADKPYEEVITQAPESAVYGWAIRKYSATETAVSFDLNMRNLLLDDPLNPNPHWYDHERSLTPPADNASPGFMAVAALGRAPAYTQETYSSEGPTRDLRLAPEIAAPADVATSVYGSFAGTSAASPHLAGAAALVLQSAPASTPAELESYLSTNAVDLGSTGPDNVYGFGRLQLPAPSPLPSPPAPGDHRWSNPVSGDSGNESAVAGASDSAGYPIAVGTAVTSGGDSDIRYLSYDLDGVLRWDAVPTTWDGAGGNDSAAAVVVDNANDCVYVAGTTRSADGDDDFVVLKLRDAGAPSGELLWAKTYNATANGDDQAAAIARDSYGNVYVTGSSQRADGSKDVLTVKYRADGTRAWARRHDNGGSRLDRGLALAVRGSSLFVAGVSRRSGHLDDIVLIKYSLDGTRKWLRYYDDSLHRSETLAAIALTSSSVYLCGSGKGDALLLKYGFDGAYKWARYVAGSGGSADAWTDVAVDNMAAVHVTGYCTRSASGKDIVTRLYTSTGAWRWQRSLTTAGKNTDVATALAVDADRRTYVCGYLTYTGGDRDVVVIKYGSSAGATLWSAEYPDPIDYPGELNAGNDWAADIAVAGSSVYAAGRQTVDYGGGNINTDFLTLSIVR